MNQPSEMEASSGLGIYRVSTPAEIKTFLEFPYTLYRHHPQWIAPLRMEQKKLVDVKGNPFYEDAELAMFVATKNGVTAGRIAAILNHAHNRHHQTQVGFFGFFDVIDDQQVCNWLLKAATDWISSKGIHEIHGPTSPGMMDVIGVLIEGFDQDPGLLMAYNYDYYDRLLLQAGMQKAVDLLAYRVTKETVTMDRMHRASELVMTRNPGLTIRDVNKRRFEEEAKIIRDIFNKAWARNWGFVPISERQFDYLAKDLKTVVDTDFAHIAEINGTPVAFSVSLPDLNQALKHINGKLLPFGLFKLLYYARKIRQVRTALMGVIPEFQGRGIDALLYSRTIKNGLAKNYESAELSWVLETNIDMMRVAERAGAHVEKKYRMYTKTFD
jgi:GNAT superfamily N-acetyltransferase